MGRKGTNHTPQVIIDEIVRRHKQGVTIVNASKKLFSIYLIILSFH